MEKSENYRVARKSCRVSNTNSDRKWNFYQLHGRIKNTFRMHIRSRRRFVKFLLMMGCFTILFFLISSLLMYIFKSCVRRAYNTNITFNEAGVIDTSSRWKKLGLETYLFTAYMDDRIPDSPLISVLGFDSRSELLLDGTLLLHGGERIPLGSCKEKRALNPNSFKQLKPYAYLWPLPSQVTNATYLKSILVQQLRSIPDATAVEIQIKLPVFSRKSFGVCIESPLFGPMKATTIIENIEINKVLGAEWFTFYIYKADQAVIQVLHEYAAEGTVEIVENWGDGLPEDDVHYYGQTLSINECAYRNMYRVNYLVYTDLDEFIVPRKSIGWANMMKEIENDRYATYMFRNAFFFEKIHNSALDKRKGMVRFSHNGSCGVELPKFLTSVYRSWNVYEAEVKSKYIIKPFCPSVCLVHEVIHKGNFALYVVPPDYALMNHYRTFRNGELPDEENIEGRQRILDWVTVVYLEKIVAGLSGRLCRPRRKS